VGKHILIDAFTHPMISLTQNHYPSQEGMNSKKTLPLLGGDEFKKNITPPRRR
jgi:hypothetical protein